MSQKNEAFFRKHYKELKALKQEDAAKAKPDHFKSALQNAGDKKTSLDQARNMFVTYVKLAHSLSEDEFVDAAMNNEMPPIRLTTKEMEVLRGGIAPTGAYMPDGNTWRGATNADVANLLGLGGKPGGAPIQSTINIKPATGSSPLGIPSATKPASAVTSVPEADNGILKPGEPGAPRFGGRRS